jgi:FlaA1/EpsC-like NDP-sugar epimerase
LNHIDGQRILITGGTGSLGTALVKRLLSGANGEPKSITIFSRDELKQAVMKSDLHDERLKYIIGDVRNYESVLCATSRVDIIFNAAALKRVEVCEQFPDEAIATNYLGASNIVKAIREFHSPVKVLVNVGSDKGCRPLNVYGMTKALQEARFLVANTECPDTRFIGVRYGNVMGSRGSVIPIWQNQVKNRQPVTVTDPDMTRFLVSLDQAVDTLFESLDQASPGEVYIPILPAARMGDIAKSMAGELAIKIIGKGPGEKMHETLITEDETERVEQRGQYYVITKQRQTRPVINNEYISSGHLITGIELENLLARYKA